MESMDGFIFNGIGEGLAAPQRGCEIGSRLVLAVDRLAVHGVFDGTGDFGDGGFTLEVVIGGGRYGARLRDSEGCYDGEVVGFAEKDPSLGLVVVMERLADHLYRKFRKDGV